MAAENEIQKKGVKHLRGCGYTVRVMSAPVKMLKQFSGLPDVWVFGPNFLWMIETKAPAGKMRDSQREFYETIRPFLGRNLRYSVPRSYAEIVIEAAQLPPAR